MTPETVAKAGTEHALQAAFFCALSQAPTYLPELSLSDWELLRFTFAVPNGGARDVVSAGRLKAEGVKPGVPDVCVPVARGPFSCLWLEFKKPHRLRESFGGASEAQMTYSAHLESQRHKVVLVYGWEHALKVVTWYLKLR